MGNITFTEVELIIYIYMLSLKRTSSHSYC